MRQKRIMALFGQTEILIVLRMWVYFRRLFLCGGRREGEGEKGVFYHHPGGIRNLEGNPKGAGRRISTACTSGSASRTVSLLASPFLLSMYKYMTVSSRTQ